MDRLIKREIASIINQIQRGDAPIYSGDEGDMLTHVTSLHAFAVIDTKDSSQIITDYGNGTANYINGEENNTYTLKFIRYDDYLHRFVYDDGKGNQQKSRLKNGVKVADYIVYDTSDDKDYIIIHELSAETAANKFIAGRKQLSDTLNQLYKSEAICNFLNSFKHKLCYLSAKDGRGVQTNGLADAFMNAYTILPEPLKFNFGQIRRYGFDAYESSIVILSK